ncbi:MAG: transposase [Planctomycetes bacterium]|nr:transposase [Planctomycetota bacterium]
MASSDPSRVRRTRDDSASDARFITFSCTQRKPFLSKDRTRTWFVEALERSRRTHGFHLWAWVIMPEHVHLLLWPGSAPFRLADALYTLKKSVSNRALSFVRNNTPQFLDAMADIDERGRGSHRFWQRGGGYDRNTYTAREIWEKIDYIHANPVQRGLCEHPTDWPWSSAKAFAMRSSEPIAIDFDSLPPPPPGYHPPF